MAGVDWSYAEMIESCAQYNHMITLDRQTRVPFLDAQTGIAQVPCHMWRSRNSRLPVVDPRVAFRYPIRRWRRKKPTHSTGGYLGFNVVNNSGDQTAGAQTDAVEARTADVADTSRSVTSTAKTTAEDQYWYDDYDDIGLDDYEDPSDADDYEEQLKRKRKKKSSKSSKKASNFASDSADRPFGCPHCSMRYKTKPGLHYHMRHHHVTDGVRTDTAVAIDHSVLSASTSGSSRAPPLIAVPSPAQPVQPLAASCSNSVLDSGSRGARTMTANRRRQSGFVHQNIDVSNTCDLCLGDVSENKKTNRPEQLISCSDCGRSGHPSCLQFTANMVVSTKTYGWQCIECKSCVICGTSENDEQLLFCDDCDRGFHMYCLTPKLFAPPEGTWSCEQCQQVFAYQRCTKSAASAMQSAVAWPSGSAV